MNYLIPFKSHIMKRIVNILKIGLVLILETGAVFGIWALEELIYFDYYRPMKKEEHRSHIEELMQKAQNNPDKAVSLIYEIIETNNTVDAYYKIYDLMTPYIVPILEEASKFGNPESQYHLGRWYMGWEVFSDTYINSDKNEEKGAYWFLQSAENKYSDAYGRIGICYKNGFGVKQDFKKCIDWLIKGADAGSAYAQYHLGCIYEVGLYVKYLKWSSHIPGEYYWSEGIVNNDIKNSSGDIRLSKGAVRYYKLGGKKDYLTDYQISCLDEKKTITYLSKDIDKAKHYWNLAADNGFEGAKEKLQRIY